ncbi:lysophosphatidylcholine acyltransferase 2-like [Eleutherodactylus coqui]|uniref:lysophosphatidylcholine acyltransferase 2-like n=1 Tax=Eleutherodactylus coqui TaxID=57060 RepID=UPI003461F1B7
MAFKLFDIDGDGSITENEFSSLLRSSLGVPDLDVSKLFQDMDADESGKLCYEEFKNFFLSHPEYSKLFTTYLDHQKYYLHVLQQEEEEDKNLEPFIAGNQGTKSSIEEATSSSDKKVD